jgi:hypothetical protein
MNPFPNVAERVNVSTRWFAAVRAIEKLTFSATEQRACRGTRERFGFAALVARCRLHLRAAMTLMLIVAPFFANAAFAEEHGAPHHAGCR